MLLHATSDASDRPDEPASSDSPDLSEPAATPASATRPEQPDVPEPTSEIEPGAPARAPQEPFPAEPAPPEPPSPEATDIAPPDAPEIVPPDAPETTPPSQSERLPPASAEPPAWTEDAPRAHPATPSPPPATSAPVPPAPERRSPLQRAALALLVIAAAALIGYVLSRPDGREAGSDVLTRSVEAAGKLRLVLETDTPAEARQFVREEFGWRVGVPVFEAAPLRGVAIAQTAPAVEVPVFLYADVEDHNVAVFAYSYALLDQVPDRLRLTAVDYDDLDDGAPFVRRAGGRDVVLWRDRDDIYVAVTDLPPDALTAGLAMAR